MAKGNMFLSQARGKVGSVVFSVIRGQQVERVYNAQPANPRTLSQQAQRSLLANMTKFYKRGAQNFFKFAFEDRTIRESDFNAFARHNMQAGVYMPKELYDDNNTPALGKYVVTDGSISTNMKDYFSGDYYGIVVPVADVVATVGSLSSALIAESPQVVQGDIFTMVLADSDFDAEMTPAGSAPTWQIYQFFIDPSDLRPLSAVGLTDFGLVGGDTGRLVGVQIAGIDRASFGATIISRNTPDGLKVTKSELKGSAVANVLYDWLRGAYMRQVAATTWGGNPEAILQGGEIVQLPEITGISFTSGTAGIQPSYSYGEGVIRADGATFEIYVGGTNLRPYNQGGRLVLKFYTARDLSDGLVVEPIKIIQPNGGPTGTTGGSYSYPSSDIAGLQQGYILLQYDDIPVWYGQVVVTS